MITLNDTLTHGRTPLDGESGRRRDLYLTTHNIPKRQRAMSPTGFEPTSPQAGGRRSTPWTIQPPVSADINPRINVNQIYFNMGYLFVTNKMLITINVISY